MRNFTRRCRLPVPPAEAYRWHERPGAFERLTPPWSRVELLERTGGIGEGRVVFRVHDAPVPMRWVAEHSGGIVGREFRDRQVEGPFAAWEHVHRFEGIGAAESELVDAIDYEPPLHLGLIDALAVRPMLDRMFGYRHRVTAHDLAVHARLSREPRHFLVSGASGLIGSALRPFLTTGGHRVTSLARRSPLPQDAILWDPASGTLTPEGLAPVDTVVHLAGESVAGARWNDEVKQRILQSRSDPTRRLCETLARLKPRPKTLVCASAIGFYGDRGEDWVDEESEPGRGFLADVCRAWEAATAPAAEAGIRVVHLRIGVVLTPAGGALGTLLTPFRFGLGGRVGSGRQSMSWIAMDDLLAAILHCAATPELEGPVNAVSPVPVTNAEFTRVLAGVLKRPAFFPLPASVARVVLGEMADEMLLGGARVKPARLQNSGFSFWLPELRDALRHVLGA